MDNRSSLERRLREEGRCVHEVPRDGHCIPASIAAALHVERHEPATTSSVIDMLKAEIYDRLDHYSNFITEESSLTEQLDDYITDKVFNVEVGDLFIEALACAVRVKIHILQVESDVIDDSVVITPMLTSATRSVHLVRRGTAPSYHYDALVDVQDQVKYLNQKVQRLSRELDSCKVRLQKSVGGGSTSGLGEKGESKQKEQELQKQLDASRERVETLEQLLRNSIKWEQLDSAKTRGDKLKMELDDVKSQNNELVQENMKLKEEISSLEKLRRPLNHDTPNTGAGTPQNRGPSQSQAPPNRGGPSQPQSPPNRGPSQSQTPPNRGPSQPQAGQATSGAAGGNTSTGPSTRTEDSQQRPSSFPRNSSASSFGSGSSNEKTGNNPSTASSNSSEENHSIWDDAVQLQSGPPVVFLLYNKTTILDKVNKIEMRELGGKAKSEKSHTILLTGMPGSGKTALINSMANYYYGLGFYENKRIKVQEGDDMAERDWITIYRLYPPSYGRTSFTLNLVDTPAFEPIKAHGLQTPTNQITEARIKVALRHVDRLDVVGVVLNIKGMSREKKHLQEPMSRMLSIFKEDQPKMSVRFQMMTSQEDESSVPDPLLLTVLKGLRLECKMYYKFNTEVSKASASDKKAAPLWNMGKRSYDELMASLQRTLVS